MIGIDVDIVEYELGTYKEYQAEIDAITTQQLKKYYRAIATS